MKTSNSSRLVPLVIWLLLICSNPWWARADRIKAANATAFNSTASWSGTTLPTSSEFAVWDSTFTGNAGLGLGANITFGGIKITNNAAATAIIVTNDPNTLTLNGVSGTGIDMSWASTNFTINSGVSLGAAQTWSVTNAQVLTAGGTVSGTGPLTKTGGGTLVLANGSYTGGTTVSAGTLTPAGPVMAGLQLWLDASDTSTLTLSGATNGVTTWVDKSGRGNNATAGNAPLFTTNVFLSATAPGQGRVVRFGLINNFLNVNLSSIAGRSYTVIAMEVQSNAAGFFIGNNGGSADNVLQVGYTATGTFRFTQWNNDMDFTIANTAKTPRIWTARFHNDVKYLYLNGAQVTSGTGAANLQGAGLATGYIGSTSSATGNPYHGDLAEILVYNRSLNDAERKTVEAYLLAKWMGSRGGLPSGGLTVASGATFDLLGNSQNVGTLSDSGASGGTIDNSGSGATLTLNVASLTNTFSGNIVNTAPYPGLGLALTGGSGVLQLNGTNSAWNGTSTLGSGTTLLVSNGSGNVVISGGLNGSGNVTKTGNGTLTLNNTNPFTGNLTINGGKLTVATNGLAGRTPPSVSAVPKIWLDASDAATVITNASGSVTNWLDKSGNNNNFNTVLGTGTLIRYTNNTTVSGLKTVTFPGAGSLMNSTYTNSTATITVFVVSRYKTTGAALNNAGPMSFTDGANQDFSSANNFTIDYQNANPPTPVFERNSATASYGAYDPGYAYHVTEALATGSGNIISINGAGSVTNTGTTSSFSISRVSVGSRLNGAAGQSYYSGDIAEVLVYSTALSAAERQAIQSYLYFKWMVRSTNSAVASVSGTPLITVGSSGTLDLSQFGSAFTLNGGQTLAGSGLVTGSVATAASAALRPGGTGAAGTLTITNGSLTLDANTTNYFDLTSTTTVGGGINDLVAVNGNLNNLSTGSKIVVNELTGSLATGKYTLFKYSGTRSGANDATVIFTGGSAPTSYALDYSTANEVDLNVTTGGQVLGSLTFTQQPSATAAGASISPSVQVTALDTNSAIITNLFVSINLTNASMGTLSGTLTASTDTNGVAAFSNLSVNLAGSGKYLVAASGTISNTSSAFTINPAAANKLVIQTQPSSTATAGVVLNTQPVIQIADQFGNVVTGDSSTVVTAAATNGTLQSTGSLTATASSGIATFSGLNLTNAIVNALTFTSSPSLTGVQSASVTVSAAAAATLAFVQNPTSTNSAQVIAPAVTVSVKDAFGNSVSGVAVAVSLNGTGALSGTRTNSSVSGIATFNNLSVDLAGSKTLTATNATATSATSTAFIISGGKVTQLIWTTQPGLATNGLPFIQQPVLQTADQFGNLSTSGLAPAQPVTITLNAGTGPLLGTTNVNIGTVGSNGIVTFTDLEIDSTGSDKQLTASTIPGFGSPVAGAAIWLDANDASTIITNATGSVTNWVDKSGNGNNFNQLVGSGFIGYTNKTTPSGRGTVTFNTGLLRNATYRNTGTNISVFIITKKRTTGNSNGSQFQGPLATTDGVNQDFNVPNAFAMDYGTAESTPVVERNSSGPNYGTYEPSTAYHDFEYIANASSNTLYINGGTGVTGGSGGAFGITNITVGGRASGPQLYDGDIAEVLVYNTNLSTVDRQAVETYLSNKWMTATYATAPSNAVTAVFTVSSASSIALSMETAADGSGSVFSAQNVTAGSSVTAYSIVRDAGVFVSNSIVTWSLISKTGGVVDGDLVAAGDNKSAVFTGHLVGSAIIRAFGGGIASSGVQTVVAGSAGQTKVETAADGSGVVAPSQNLAAGASVNLYAISRDSQGNFLGNVAATWSLVSKTGGVVDGDLVAAGDNKSATFTGHVLGSAIAQAVANTFTGQSGTLTVNTGGTVSQLAWTTQPGSATVSAPFSQQPVLQTEDQYGNPTTSGLGATQMVTVSLSSGTGPLAGTTTFNIGTAGSNGVADFSDLQINSAGTGKQLTASVGGSLPSISNLQLWLDASDLTSVTNVGAGLVSGWNDKSGNARNATQATNAFQPTLVTNSTLLPGGIGAGRALRFNGATATNFLNVPLGFMQSGAAYTIVSMEGRLSAKANNYFIGILDPSGDHGLHAGYKSGTQISLNQFSAADLNLTIPAFASQQFVAAIRMMDATGHYIFTNGVVVGNNASTTGLSGSAGGVIGSGFDLTTTLFHGDIAEILIYDRGLTTTERSNLVSYLNTKWLTGLTPAVSTTFTVSKAGSSSAVASSSNPSGFGDGVTFTNTVTTGVTATGNVVFLLDGTPFSTNTLASGAAASAVITTIPRGTHTITAQYAGDSNVNGVTNDLSGGQVVTNHPPAAVTLNYSRNPGVSMKLTVSSLLTAVSDADSDTQQLVSVSSTTTNGASIPVSGGLVFVPASSVADAFTYTYQDGNGGTNTGTVLITISGSFGQQTSVTPTPSNAVAVFFGIPGVTYLVERATNVTFDAGVNYFPPVEAPSDGAFIITDDFSDMGGVVPNSAFYRLLTPSN